MLTCRRTFKLNSRVLQEPLTLNGYLGSVTVEDPGLEGDDSDFDHNEWHDCTMDEESSDLPTTHSEEDKERWHDCKSWTLPNALTKLFPPRKMRYKDHGSPLGYPCVLMILSNLMWSMYSIGMLLMMKGMTWEEFQWDYYLKTFQSVVMYF